MEPTQNGGNSGIPGVKPGVIASGPDTSGTEAPAVPGVGTSGTSTVGVPGALGISGVGMNAQNPNGVFADLSRNSGGSRLNNDGPITPQPIDTVVVDGGGGPKKSRKGLLVAGIALIGVALIVGVVALLVMNFGNNDNNTATTAESLAFNNMARYMLFGNEKGVGKISETELDNTVFMGVIRSWTYEAQKAYFSQAEGYINELGKILDDEDLSKRVDDLSINTKLLEKIGAIAYTDVLWTAYLSNGALGVQNYIAEVKETVSLDDASTDTANNVDELASILIDIYTQYEERGCVVDKVLDTDCTVEIAEEGSALLDMTDKMANLVVNLRRYVRNLGGIILMDIKTMNETQGYIIDDLEKEEEGTQGQSVLERDFVTENVRESGAQEEAFDDGGTEDE